MLVLLNCSTLFKGGGVQAAVSFIRTALQQKDDIKWNFVLSRRVFDELQGFDLAKELSDVSVVEVSPARNSRSRDALRRLEKEINPDVVFTFFGPAYVSFSKPHLCGVADGWVTHGGYWAWKTMRGIKDVSRSICLVAYKAYMYRKADAWVTEAMIAKKGLARRLCIAERRIGIVPNNCGEHYLHDGPILKEQLADENMVFSNAAFLQKETRRQTKHRAGNQCGCRGHKRRGRFRRLLNGFAGINHTYLTV